MNSLFLRIFLWFCGATAAIVIVVGLGFVADSPGALATNWRDIGRNAVVVAGRTAVESYERGGKSEALRYLHLVAGEIGLQGVLLDSSGRSLSGNELGLNAAQVDRLKGRQEGELEIFPLQGFAGAHLRSEGGASYLFVASLPPRAAVPWARSFIGLFIITGGLLCYLLARHVSSPVVQVRAATARFSHGELGVRITSARVLQRQDEIGGLARDFNQMATRIETLLRTQQRLIADVSHELRSPITRLSLALGLLRRESAPATSLARMEREVERLKALVDQLLTLSRLESLEQPPPMESFELSALVREIAADADFEAANLDRSVRLVESAACLVRGAPDLVRSAIENVVRNAVRYTRPNTSVLIRLLHAGGSDIATIVVEDEGPGVPEAELAHMFEPFYRVDQARERHTGGAGLGLAITHRVAGLHGGSVAATNREQGGLAIRITLPADDFRESKGEGHSDI
jgi:two-component system sensor histidine kinase CpxA